ncbi:MAG: PQQ-binding-like beta-propeller repeat protein [Bacteroidota bacterium]
MLRFSCLLLLLSLFMNCKKVPSELSTNEDQTPFPQDTCVASTVLWKTILTPDTSDFFTDKPVLYKDQVLFTVWRDFDQSEKLFMLDAATGEIKWEWSDYIYHPSLYSSTGQHIIRDNIYYFTTQYEVYAIDLDLGATKWVYTVPEGTGEVYLTLHEDWLFHGHVKKYPANTHSHLVVAPLPAQRPQWDTLYSTYIQDGYSPYMGPPVVWENPDQEQVLLFKESHYNFSNHNSYSGITAFNMNQKEVSWKIDSFDISTTVELIITKGNLAFFEGYRSVFCVDLLTGTIRWQQEFPRPQTLASSNIMVLDDRVIVNTDTDDMYALSIESGYTIWRSRDSGSTCWDLNELNGQLYYTCLGERFIQVVDPYTGEHLPKACSPFRAPTSISDLTIHPEKGVAYTVDGFAAVAISLKEE